MLELARRQGVGASLPVRVLLVLPRGPGNRAEKAICEMLPSSRGVSVAPGFCHSLLFWYSGRCACYTATLPEHAPYESNRFLAASTTIGSRRLACKHASAMPLAETRTYLS